MLMFTFTSFAHAGHDHTAEVVNGIGLEHCTAVIIISGLIITALLSIILYFLVKWQPKKKAKAKPVKKSKPASKKE